MENQSETRDAHILRSLVKYPLTVDSLFRLSQTFPRPLPSVTATAKVLTRLKNKKETIRAKPCLHDKKNERGAVKSYYYPTSKVRAMIPELSGFAASSPCFRPLSDSCHRHDMAIAEFMVNLEIAIHKNPNLKLIEYMRSGDHRPTIQDREGERAFVPDGTIILEKNGRRQIYFLEWDNSTETLNPRSRKRSNNHWRAKIENYDLLNRQSERDPVLAEFKPRKFKVLVLTRSRERAENIFALARSITNKQFFVIETQAGAFKNPLFFMSS